MNIREQIRVPAILGPTATGKTSYSVELAKRLDGEIISCDSMQVYSHMTIGSAAIKKEEMQGIAHHLIGEISPLEDFSVAKYQKMARMYIRKVHEKNKIPIVVGGSGLYYHSIFYNMDFATQNVDPYNPLRTKLYELANTEGCEALHSILYRLDPASAERIHPNNLKKVVRAIEAIKLGSRVESFDRSNTLISYLKPLPIILYKNRQTLYEQINKRVDNMIEAGLIDEVKTLLSNGAASENISMKGIGYKEIINYLEGKSSMEAAVENIKKNSRHLAKRQITWFKKYKDALWISLDDKDQSKALEEGLKWLKNQL